VAGYHRQFLAAIRAAIAAGAPSELVAALVPPGPDPAVARANVAAKTAAAARPKPPPPNPAAPGLWSRMVAAFTRKAA